MIGQILVRTRRPVGELPTRIQVRLVGLCGEHFPVILSHGTRSGRVMVLDLITGKVTPMDATIVVDAYIPESWEDARWDIALALMNEGVI